MVSGVSYRVVGGCWQGGEFQRDVISKLVYNSDLKPAGPSTTINEHSGFLYRNLLLLWWARRSFFHQTMGFLIDILTATGRLTNPQAHTMVDPDGIILMFEPLNYRLFSSILFLTDTVWAIVRTPYKELGEGVWRVLFKGLLGCIY